MCAVLTRHQIIYNIHHTDNVNQHLDERAKDAIRATGALLVFMPTYSPEWNPVPQLLYVCVRLSWMPVACP
jgi:transposase